MKVKNIIFVCLLIVQASVAIAQHKSITGYTLTGKVKGIADGEVELSSFDAKTRTNTSVNKAKIKDGKFVMSGKLNTAEMMSLTFTPGNWSTYVFLENKAITLSADTAGSQYYDNTKHKGKKGAQLKQVKVSGSVSHTDFEAYENSIKGVANREEIPARQMDYMLAFVAKKSESVAGVYMLSNYYMFHAKMPLADLEQMMKQFKGAARESLYFRNLQKEIAERKAVLPGNFAEDFTLLKRDSTRFTLSSTRGKYVLIDFWASWCKPCRKAIPHWKEVYAKYGGKDFEIVSVANDKNWNDWFKAMDVEQMPWIQIADEFPLKNMPSRVLSRYKHGSIPLYVLLDKEGKILVKSGNEEDVDHKLAELLGN